LICLKISEVSLVWEFPFKCSYLKPKKPLLAPGTKKKPINKAKIQTITAPNIKGRKNLEYEIPELKIAIISVLFANFEVNQIIDKNKKIGNNRLAKYTVKSP
jgi:hypothetical protein